MTENVPDIIHVSQEIDLRDIEQQYRYERKQEQPDEFDGLTKGKYDIDYSIGICRMVLGHCDHHKICTSANLAISLKHSLNKLIKFLESEKIPKNSNPVILFTCPVCKHSEVICAHIEDKYQCQKCCSECCVSGYVKKVMLE